MSSKQPKFSSFIISEPPSESDPEKSQPIYAVIGESMAIWTRVENELFLVYVSVAHPDGFGPGISASFHAVAGFRNRLMMVGALLRNTFIGREYAQILSEWRSLEEVLREANKKRNSLAHGVVVNWGEMVNGERKSSSTGWVPYFAMQDFANTKNIPTTQKGRSIQETLSIQELTIRKNDLLNAGKALIQFRHSFLRGPMPPLRPFVIDDEQNPHQDTDHQHQSKAGQTKL